ncbi:hypothetical protein [Parageobacillus thermoglucosidasius]|uniref:hypothetical protein n=1 Tax=Parageobacillus thermoglucosidasius TaxID=1426 RepID=UPI00025B592D|nr:hypothetical protein [Parageobacillus thermoglucosidasius]KYD17323.1 hypothetical protein B4168_1723 [Anoxybacillus flavithermus]REK53965.1 MAG: hypothetical protein C6P36_15180 [Geobacillus sp.]ALF10463.1 hypothetical protein AOT13_10790 [Parageobacillus thermoglucosidasius]EID44351.1 hypothetical protein GT20_2074 [Parageobacillus thermoglucosidasius TNO-09.020]OAO84378.1 hypothetical protein GT23_3913 [Parageobacillus thermoglucosidasius]
MGIEVRSLIFDNLLIYETRQRKQNWLETYFWMEDFTLTHGIYKNGPVFFSVSEESSDDASAHFTYYLPINEPVQLTDETHFRFQRKLHIKKALVLRQADEELDFQTAYKKLKDYAVNHQILLENTYYCVLLEVYDDYLIDLYVPIKKMEE